MSYTVEVTREGDAWIADVVDLPGAHTYARNLTALADAVQEVIALVADLPDDAGVQDITYRYLGVEDVFVDAGKVGEARRALEDQQQALNQLAAAFVLKLTEDGFSVRDIAGVLKMSPGRVSQIANQPPTARKEQLAIGSGALGSWADHFVVQIVDHNFHSPIALYGGAVVEPHAFGLHPAFIREVDPRDD